DGSLKVLTHPPAVDELHRVLAYRQLKIDPDRQRLIFAEYQRLTVSCALPAGATLKNLMLPGGFPRCRDRDDEPFLALAYHQRAAALVSRDHAVLGLASRTAKFGLTILNVQQAITRLPAVKTTAA
ncbi:MAG: PIN domain-containing protein, partial [Betaproteobacteria bacterium]|nr:PIN domain-containing protein [Betaproteobacteria bacterium]